METHGLSNTRLYQTWCNMKARCYNHKNTYYYIYGERGIIVCPEWKDSFEKFYQWAMENGYNDTLTIDRIDFNGNYEPSNCRWVGHKVQGNNTSRNKMLEYNGKTQTMSLWADEVGISYYVLRKRIYTGWDVKDALFTPVMGENLNKVFDKDKDGLILLTSKGSLRVYKICDYLHINRTTIKKHSDYYPNETADDILKYYCNKYNKSIDEVVAISTV